MKRNRPLFFTLFAVIVFCATVSQNVFAQTESSRLYLKSGLEVMKQPVVEVEEDPVLSAHDGLGVLVRADCQAGQTVHPGEQCTYPGTSFEFRVDSSGDVTISISGVTFGQDSGGTLNIDSTVNGRRYIFIAEGQSDGSWFLQQVGDDTATSPGSEETITVVYDTGQNQDEMFFRGAAGNIMAQRYEVLPGARLTSVLVAPMYDNQFTSSPVPDGAPRDFTLKIWNVDGGGLPGEELYSMDVDEASDATHITQDLTYSFLQVDFPADEEALAALPDLIFIGLTDKGTDENYLGFATSRRNDTAPDDAAYSYETINSNTRWYLLANLTAGGQSLGDQVFPIRPRFLVPSGTQSEETILAYDTGQNEDRIYLFGNAEDIMAQRYEVPSGSRLASVSVAPVYDNQFNNSTVPDGSPRDFTLRIWNVDGDGLPGDDLYSIDVDEDVAASHLRSDHTYLFFSIDFTTDEEVFSALPDRIFIGLANKGTDENYLVMAPSRRKSNAPDDIAYLYRTINSNTRWYPFASITVSGSSLRDQAFPIRARFIALPDPVSTDDPAELPSGVRLAQNYPNPFNPITSISWVQPVSAQVRLSVYNLLGKKMATPVDGLHPVGEHEVRLDASGWPSGVYVYMLETGSHRLARRMVLLK